MITIQIIIATTTIIIINNNNNNNYNYSNDEIYLMLVEYKLKFLV